MPNPPVSTSELTWLVAVVIAQIATAAASIAVALITRRDTKADLARTQTSVDTITEQVKNTHTQNLREDLDEKFAAVGARLGTVTEHVTALRDDVGGLHSETRDIRKDVTGIRTDARRARRDIATQQDVIDELPAMIEKAIGEHVAACPARQAPPTK